MSVTKNNKRIYVLDSNRIFQIQIIKKRIFMETLASDSTDRTDRSLRLFKTICFL